jgi:predicted enzyme related to lactoylglutathione lyase
MERVTGIGGIFFKAKDPKGLAQWYQKHLGLEVSHDTMATFHWRESTDPGRKAYSVWSAFPEQTGYFDPSSKPFMVNYRVADLDGLLAQLRREGVSVDDRIEESEFGRFGWVMDPEGNRIELWQPGAPDGG